MTVMLDGTARIDSASISKRSVDLDTKHLSINRTVSSHSFLLFLLFFTSLSLSFHTSLFLPFSFCALLVNRLKHSLGVNHRRSVTSGQTYEAISYRGNETRGTTSLFIYLASRFSNFTLLVNLIHLSTFAHV